MSRLFSHLENIGHDQTAPQESAVPAENGMDASRPHSAKGELHGPPGISPSIDTPFAADRARAQPDPASSPRSPIPGYAIASQLALSSTPASPVAPSRPSWPVRLWFFALLTLIGLSLAMLLSPRTSVQDNAARMQPSLPRPSSAIRTPGETGARSLPSSPVRAQGAAEKAVEPPARPAARPPVARQPSLPAAAPATTPARPPGDAACGAAMAAMNLCSTPHP